MLLPKSSLVAFSTTKLRDPIIVFHDTRASGVSDECLLQELGYVVNEADLELDGMCKTFYADRYGGSAIYDHGGGARCGTDLNSGLQVKGIGPNPLVGRHAEYWHGNGALAMQDALREFIWGEILAPLLPFGACKVVAIIDTGLTCWIKHPDQGKRKTKRALLIRKAAVRPAHFERAVYFRVPKGLESVISPDYCRVEDAIALLPDVFASTFCIRGYSHTQERQLISSGLAELAKRAACQMAYAKVNRIEHGAISSSNVAIDGAWLDHGSVTVHRTFRGLPTPRGSFWTDYRLFFKILGNMCFYTNKYFAKKVEHPPFDANALCASYAKHYSHFLAISFLNLLGIDRRYIDILLAKQPGNMSLLSRCLITLGERSAESSDLDFPGVIPGLSCLATGRHCSNESGELLKGPAYAECAKLYRWAFNEAAALAGMDGVSRTRFGDVVVENAFSRWADNSVLYRYQLSKHLDRVVEEFGHDASLMLAECKQVLAKATPLFANRPIE